MQAGSRPEPTHSLNQAEQALIDQAVLGLIDADRLPGSGDVVYLDEEGTPVARRTGATVTSLQPLRWPSPDGSLGPVLIPAPGRLPIGEIAPEVTVLLPLGGVRPDDHRAQSWAAEWRAAAARSVEVPVAPGDAGMAGRLAAAYGNGELATVDTEAQFRSRGRTVLLSGLSGSGKSTIARALVAHLAATEPHRSITLLDGDVVRTHLSKGLGFSREDRDINVRRIGWVAAEITKHGGLAVCAPIAPYDETRKWVRATVDAAGGPESFLLVWVSTPIEVCEQRDVKGLYAKARAGELSGLTGVDDPYEVPADAQLVIDTSVVELDTAVARIVALL